jgi:D-inositol-3-phosphate glycosyltransferase
MRLAIVGEAAFPPEPSSRVPDAGHHRRLTELASALQGAGHDVRLYGRADDSPGVFGRRLAAGWSHDGWRPDLVHAHFWLSGMAAAIAGRWTRIPVAVTFHEVGLARRAHLGDADTSPRSRVGMEQRLARTVDRIITQTRAESDDLLRLGVARRRISLVPTGVDPGVFHPRGRATGQAASGPAVTGQAAGPAPLIGVTRRILSVGSVAGLDERRGFTDVICALPQIPDTELVVIGGRSGSATGGDPRAARLRGLADGCGVGDRVRLVDGVSREQMPAWYRSADLVVCASWYEPFGLPAVEAMACGVPVVATAVGGLRDTVVDRVTGALVPPRHPGALAQAVRGVLADPVRRLGYAAAARDRAIQCYAWERVAPRLAGEYRRLCTRVAEPEPGAATAR